MITLEGNIYWKKVDIWALGITLYWMLNQGPPEWSREYKRDDTGQVVDYVLTLTNIYHPAFQEFQRSSESNNNPVHVLLHHMLHNDPQERWSTNQVLDFLDSVWT